MARSGSELTLEARAIGGKFKGEIAKDLQSIPGTWSQGGGTLPLTLKRVKNAVELERRRPQNPVKPYPYGEEEVAVSNAKAGLKLSGTVTLPSGNGLFPAVVLITGSGPQDRDESLMGHRPFLVLADYLTRRGIAVLRMDDRGVGKSEGTFESATTADFATDAEAGINYLKTRPEIDGRKIGLIGHSEGGVIAPMVAARNRQVAFLVMMAGTGVDGEAVLREQTALILEASGKSREDVMEALAQHQVMISLVKAERDDRVLERKLREQLALRVPEAQIGAQVKMFSSPWFRYFIEYDPAVALRQVRCPVLALDGEKDLQVSPKQNLPAIRKALQEAGNQNFEVNELPSLNHLFQTAKTGAPSEYAEIEETMSPVALEMMASWILKL